MDHRQPPRRPPQGQPARPRELHFETMILTPHGAIPRNPFSARDHEVARKWNEAMSRIKSHLANLPRRGQR